MPQFVKHFVQDLTQDIKIRQCGTIIFNADDEANVITIDLYNGEEPATLTGSVVGAVICSDGSTVPVTGGTISGNTVTLTLTGDCGAIPGPIGVGVQIVNGTQKTTVLKAVYNVELFTTDNVVDPGSRITITVSDLVQDIADAVATIPADYTDLLAAVAPNYSGLTFPVKAGTLCWYNGALYQAKQDIATSESWTAAHWDSAVLSTSVDGKIADVQEEVSSLKSAISEPTRNLWLWGDQSVTGSKLVTSSANIPAGTYTLSALVTKNESGNVRMLFYKQNATTGEMLANPYIAANSRNSKTFTLAEDCHRVLVYSAANSSGQVPAEWTDIQIEAGSTATDYTPPLTAVDVVARADASGVVKYADAQTLTDTQKATARGNIGAAKAVDVDSILSRLNRQILLTNTTYTGEHTETIILPDYNTYTETPIISCDAMFTRNSGVTDYPRAQFLMNNARGLERYSTWYQVGKEGQYEIKEWRAPAFEIWQNNEVRLSIYVPSGCTLTIRNLWLRYDCSVDRTQARGTEFFARPGTCNMVPELTIPALQMAYRHGYDTFTVVPKISSDGIWFAYHDDTFDINTTGLRLSDGSRITSDEYNGMRFDQIPFSHLNQYVYGAYGALFLDVHLMTLETCFEYLAKTGMKLCFSLHPYAGINTRLTELKRLAQKYGLLKGLKIIVNDIASVFGVFGNDIGGYIFPNATESNWTGDTKRVDVALTDAIAAKSAYGITVPITCGLWADSLFSDRSKAEQLLSDILDQGFTANVFTYTLTGIDGSSHTILWSEDIRWLMSIGVTEFTDGFNTSIGLNW